MQNIHVGPTVRVHRMSEPERGQGTLAAPWDNSHSTPNVSHCDLYTHRNPMLVCALFQLDLSGKLLCEE